MKYVDKREPAPHFVTLPPSSFDPAWSDRPRGDVACGLRTLGADSVDNARANASKTAETQLGGADSPLFDEVYNDQLVREYVALCMCDVNDVSRAPTWMTMPDSDIGFLTPEAQRHLFDECLLLAARQSPAVKELDDGEVMRLSTLLAAHTLARLPSDLRASHLRVLRVVFDDLLVAVGG